MRMKDILILKTPEEVQSTIYEINALERFAYSELSTLEENILGTEGQKKASEAIRLMDEWRPVNARILECVKDLDFDTAAELTRQESAIHLLRLEAIMTELNTYARNSATGFIMESKRLYRRAEELTVFLGILWILLSMLIVLFTIKRARSTETQLANEKERPLILSGSRPAGWSSLSRM